jgi:hypothetical protein
MPEYGVANGYESNGLVLRGGAQFRCVVTYQKNGALVTAASWKWSETNGGVAILEASMENGRITVEHLPEGGPTTSVALTVLIPPAITAALTSRYRRLWHDFQLTDSGEIHRLWANSQMPFHPAISVP